MCKSNQIKSNQIKSNQIKSNSIILLFSLLFCGILFTFSSCKNFLNAANVAEEIKEAIEIANSNPTTIYIEAPNDSGSLSQTQVKIKRNESFDLKFTPSDTWQFICWEVFDPETDQVIQDFIKFSDETKTEVKVKLLKAADKLIIKPKCFEMPVVVSVQPSSSQVAYANEPVVIIFNIPMSQEIMKYEDGYISLKHGTKEISNLFEIPSLSKDGKTITVKPKDTKLSEYIGTYNTANILVTVQLGTKIARTEIINKNIYTLPLIQNENSSFTVKYKSEMESIAPKGFDFFATASELHLTNANNIEENSKFTYEEIANQGTFTEEEYKAKIKQNRVDNTIYIYGRYYDADSGVKSVKITHKRMNSKNGNAVNESLCEPDLLTEENENTEFFTEDGYTTFCVKYFLANDKIKDDWGDGAILFTVSVFDVVGNESAEQKFTVIKDTFVDVSEVEISNYKKVGTLNRKDFSDDDELFYNDYLIPSTKHITVPELSSLSSYRGIVLKNISEDNVFLEYESKDGFIRQKMTWNSDDKIWETDLQVDHVSSLVLNLCMQDNFGNENKKIFTMPSKVEYYISFDKDGNYCYRVKTDNSMIHYIETEIGKRSLNDSYMTWTKKPSEFFNTCNTNNDYWFNYLIFIVGVDEEHNLCGDYVMVTEWLPTNTQTDSFESLSDIKIEDNIVSLCLNNDTWGIYSELSLKVTMKNCNNSNNYKSISVTMTEMDGNVISIPFPKDIFDSYTDFNIEINALKNDTLIKSHYSKSYYVNRAGTEGSYTYGIVNDNHNPELSLSFMTPSQRIETLGTDEKYLDCYILMHASDFHEESNYIISSGLNHFELYINDKKTAIFTLKDLKEVSFNKYAIPLYGRYIKDGESCKCKLIAYDNNNNTTEKELTVYGDSKTGGYTFEFIDNRSNRNPPIYTNGVWHFGIWGYYINDSKYHEQWGHDYYTYLLHYYVLENDSWIYIETDLPEEQNNQKELSSGYLYKIVPETISKSGMRYFPRPYFLNTYEESSGNYDLLMQNGNLKTSFAISSDMPVFVQTIVTIEDYATCKDWDVATWESGFPCHFGDTLLEFNPSDRMPKRYNVPVDKIHTGECYIVIAHFSNGESLKSDVFIKEYISF